MSVVKRDVWHCDVCGWEWVPSGDVAPQQCPRRSCRSRHWNAGVPVEPRRATVKKAAVEGVGAKIPEKSARSFDAIEHHVDYEMDIESDGGGNITASPVTVSSKVVRKKKVEAGEPQRCRHGLSFHLGCNA